MRKDHVAILSVMKILNLAPAVEFVPHPSIFRQMDNSQYAEEKIALKQQMEKTD